MGYRVVGLPTKSMAYSNHIYCNPADEKLLKRKGMSRHMNFLPMKCDGHVDVDTSLLHVKAVRRIMPPDDTLLPAMV